MRDFLGTLFTSVKQIKAPYLFDGNKELLCTQCRGIGPHLSASGKSDVFSRVAAEAGVCSRVMAGEVIKNFCLLNDLRTPI